MKLKILCLLVLFVFSTPLIAKEYEVPIPQTIATSTQAATQTTIVVKPPFDVHSTSSLKSIIESEFPDSPVIVDIASCESRLKQFNSDGSVRLGRANPHDIGLFQINETYHRAEAEKLGIDIDTLKGNIAFAKILHKRNGTRDWNWSKFMWEKGECAS